MTNGKTQGAVAADGAGRAQACHENLEEEGVAKRHAQQTAKEKGSGKRTAHFNAHSKS
jgi:hypothetical protein